MQFLRRDLLGLKPNISLCPGARHDDGRAHGTELRRYRPGISWRASALVSSAIFPDTPDDGVVAGACAGNVDRLHIRMIAKVLAGFDSTRDDLECAKFDQRLQCILQDIQQVIVDRIQLEDHHGMLGE